MRRAGRAPTLSASGIRDEYDISFPWHHWHPTEYISQEQKASIYNSTSFHTAPNAVGSILWAASAVNMPELKRELALRPW